MKKIMFVLVLMSLGPYIFSHIIYSAEYEFGSTDKYNYYPESEIDELINGLPDDVKNELEEYSSATDDGERVDALKDKLDIRYIMKYILSEAKEILLPTIGSFSSLLGALIIITLLKNTVSDGGAGEVCEYVISLTIAIIAGGIVLSSINIARRFITGICTIMNTMLPVMSTVMLSSGSVTSASVNSSALMLYIAVAENVTSLILVPLAGVLLALSTVSSVFKGINISSFISGVRKLIMTLLGFSLMIFSFVMGIQSSLAKSADGLAMKTVRFAMGSYIPIVGGAVSEALSTVTAGLARIRHIAGGVGIAIILLSVLPVLINLFITRLGLIICKSVSETLECGAATSIIGDAESILSLFLAFCAMTGVFFIFATVLFMNSGIS